MPSLSRGVGGLLLSSLRGGSGLPSVDNWVPGIVQGERKAPFQDCISLQKPAKAPTYNSPKGLQGKCLSSCATLSYCPNTKMMQNVINSFLLFTFRLKLTWLVSWHMPKSFNLGSAENHLIISVC